MSRFARVWSPRRRSTSGGFSLLELLITFTISIFALLLASRLLLEAQSRWNHVTRQITQPVAPIALRQLRADLRSAAGVKMPSTEGWSRDPLLLIGHPAGRLSYLKSGSELLRRIEAEDEDEDSQRPVLWTVSTWRWRPMANGTVEVDLGYRRLDRLRSMTTGGQMRDPFWVEERQVIRVRPRAGGGDSW